MQHSVTTITTQVSTLDPVASTSRGQAWDATTFHSWLEANTKFGAVREILTAAVRWTVASYSMNT